MSLLSLTDITKKSPEEMLDDNLLTMLDWEFLNAGGFVNITVPTSGAFGGERHKLGVVHHKGYDAGKIWQTYHSNLVWESGVNNAISISGLFVNNAFLPLNSGYRIDYPHGQVVFDEAKPLNTVVEMEYSHKLVRFDKFNSVPFLKRIQDSSYKLDYHDVGSGNFLSYPENRAELPVVGITSFARSTSPYALGGYSRYLNIDAKFYVLSTNESACKRIGNILTDNQKQFYLFNSNNVDASGAYPLDYLGNINTGYDYSDLIKLNIDGGYRWTTCDVQKTAGEQTVKMHDNAYMRAITWNTKIAVPGV